MAPTDSATTIQLPPSISMAFSSKNFTIHFNGPIIVGAGPSGLAAAACLSRNGIPSIILERSNCLASLWEERAYDRLKLHLPKRFCQLPFLPFPQDYPEYPTRNQFLCYLNSYAYFFSIKPIFMQTVQLAEFIPTTGLWEVTTQDDTYSSRWLIVATGENADPVIPFIPGAEKFKGNIVHTAFYKSGEEYENQKVLVVGCGNSGVEVGFDLCKHNAFPHMVVRSNMHVLPKEVLGYSTFGIAMALLRRLPLRMVDKVLLLIAQFALGDTERIGLCRPKLGPMEHKAHTGKTPVLDFGAVEHIKSGKIKVVKGVRKITENGAEFVDGKESKFDSIILATGYKSNTPTWLKGSDFFTEGGMPRTPFPNNWKGEKGLYTVGFSRRGLLGSSMDAQKVADDISLQWSSLS